MKREMNKRSVQRTTRGDDKIVRSSGNVFADLKVGDASTALLKAQLAARLVATARARKLTQTRIAALTGLDQADVSRIMTGKLSNTSVERLLTMLTRLGLDVDIVVKSGGKRAFETIRLEAVDA